jgi:PAS domain S-box-containing protein
MTSPKTARDIRDIEERKRAEEDLRRSEGYLAEAQRLTHTGSWVWQVEGRTALHLSDEWYRVYGFDPAEGIPTWEQRLQRVHPDEREKWQGAIERAISEKSDYDVQFRILLPNGAIKWVHTVGHPIFGASGELLQFLGTSMDITERKRAEEELRRSETYLEEAQKLSHTGSWAWDVRTQDVFWSDEMFRLFGYDSEKTKPTLAHFFERVHPEDRASVEERAKTESAQTDEMDSEGDFRIVLEDGTVKHLHSIAHPVLNALGEVIEVVGTTMDVTEHYEARAALETAFAEIRTLKDQLFNENIALRDEIDKASMFEEIVGDSPALQAVLTRVAKVAPTDSTVLVTGETGTGKELIARAIHKRSLRASRAFVSVNCAAIPSTLISSELFGHERGAFTGALHRRLGRFELAEGGTIFLDEIGELPGETQIALLRVLQEREFERVGGTQSIRANVRIITATNRDLESAIVAGTFRSDLFYRLNVFPIEIPALRERKEDIPTLVEYFIHRYSRNAGKKWATIEKRTLELLKSYPWPGNIRELQNVIQRSVILCDTDTFSVDASWLSFESASPGQSSAPIARKSAAQEKDGIEAALAASGGRVSGPLGAAAQLNMPASTLESKIRKLKINKFRFKNS